jgi:glycogen debranching enzyme
MEEKGYYALGIDGSGNQIMPITSNPGQLLFTGILKPEKVKAVVGRIFKNDIFTPYGIRTHSKLEPQFDPILYQLGSVWPHDNWIIAQGLWESGYQKEYESVKSALVKAAIELQCVPEYYGVSVDEKLIAPAAMRWAACDPQAWSLGALIDMLGKK